MKLFWSARRFVLNIILLLVCLTAFRQATAQNNTDSLRKVAVQTIDDLLTTTDVDKKHTAILKLLGQGIEGHPELLIEVGERLIKLGSKRGDLQFLSNGWSVLGQGFRLTGDFSRGLDAHYKAINFAKKLGNHAVIAYAYNQCGHIFKDRLENVKALSYYRLAAEEGELGPNSYGRWYPYMNLGAVFLNMGQYDSSIFYSNKALSSFKKITNNYRYEPYIRSNLGLAYGKMNDRLNADLQFAEGRSVLGESLDSRQKEIFYVALAEHFKHFNQTDSFFVYATKAIEVIDFPGYNYLKAKPAKMLADAYENGNGDSAIKYLKLYISANEILNSTRVTQQLQARSFEEEEKQREFERAQKNYRSRIQLFVLIAGLLILSLFLIYLYRNNKNTAAKNVLLASQKKEIENTLQQLKQTQTQLVHAEKMASLGELTAGIAHEIQNPLNFVNNFSDLSKELVDEMNEELEKGDVEEAKFIAADIKSNLEKINHHGNRADSIVRSMLQHSRSSSGEKQETDINKLADEYLRLSYHGLRSKEKDFNADIVTSFDESIGKILIAPQEIGRVILNLVNNAFYAVHERAKACQPELVEAPYKPTVSITTKRTDGVVKIVVADNGYGIPEKIKDKIFNPFFTTKPTGQGTGLGLSLSYDVIKAHGGEIEVRTNEAKGTSFIVTLPF